MPKNLSDITGQTVYGDRPLRFRSLTLTEADFPALDDPAAIEGAFKIRVARHTGAHRDAGALVERQYAGRGYAIPAPKHNPYLATFLAYDEGLIVGTVSVGLDSEHGLSADALYAKEIDVLRSMGHRMCEFTRLAVDKTAASKPILAGLFHTAYLYASVIRGYTHAVIEVNPRHVAFYGRALGLRADRSAAHEHACQRAGRACSMHPSRPFPRARSLCGEETKHARGQPVTFCLRISAAGRGRGAQAVAGVGCRWLTFGASRILIASATC